MTLIGAFRYGIGTPDSGVVICADSLEQLGSYRAFVKKIESRSTDLYDMVIAGAGNSADLIDDQIEALVESIRGWQNEISEEDAKRRISNVISSYHRRFVVPFQVPTEDKYLQFIVCLRSKQSGSLYLWKIESTVIKTIDRYGLIGWHDGVYYYETEWLWRSDLTMRHAALLGIRLLVIAKNNPEIDGPTRVLAISNTGLEEPYDEATIEALEQLFKELDNQIAGVILGSADLTLPSSELISRLEKFQSWAFALRKIILQIQDAHHAHTADNLTLTVDDSKQP